MAALNLTFIKSLASSGQLEQIGCLGDAAAREACADRLDEFLEHPSWMCSQQPNLGIDGAWTGHLLPGLFFILWATHWMQGTFRSYAEAQARGEPFLSRTCYSLPGVPRAWPLEAMVKLVAPVVGIVEELYFGHDWNFLYLICRDVPGSRRAGHLDGTCINDWQHATMYLCFCMSGLVDLLAPAGGAPRGTEQVFLTLSFFMEALLMGLHGKHEAMDKVLHACLTYSALATAAFCAAEVAWPRCFLLSCGRVAATFLQGIWFITAGVMLFMGIPAWDISGADLAPAMAVPLVFVAVAALVPLLMLLTWGAFAAAAHRCCRSTAPPDHSTAAAAKQGPSSPSKLARGYGRLGAGSEPAVRTGGFAPGSEGCAGGLPELE